MGVISAIRGVFGERTKASSGVPAAYAPLLGSLPSAAGVLISQATAMQVSAVYGCVSIRAEDTARCKPRLFRPLAEGDREQIGSADHPVALLLARPNRVQTWFEFAQQMEAALLLRENAYAAIIRDIRGRPIELIPLNPDAVTMLEASDGSLFYNVNRFGLWQIAMLRDLPPAIPAESIFHLRGLSFNALMGAARISLARDAIGVALGLEQQAARWMQNGARPAGVLQTDKTLTQSASDRLKAQWANLFSGIQNVGATAVLEEGLKWSALSLDAATLEFLSQRKFQVEDISRFYRVPPHKLGITDGMRGLNLPQADQEYVNDAIMPALERWEQKFVQCFDLDAEGLEVDFDENDLLRADIQTRYNVGRLGVLSGLTAPNEWRRAEKLPPIDGGDEVRAPVNLAALGSDMTGTAPDGAGRPNGGDLPDPGVATRMMPIGRVKRAARRRKSSEDIVAPAVTAEALRARMHKAAGASFRQS